MADYTGAHTGAEVDDAVGVTKGSGTGLSVKTGTGTGVRRSVAGTTDEITVTNGDGVAGNPTVGLASAVTTSLGLADTAVQPGDDADTLGSGDATDGWVLTADGVGGAAWEAASGGGADDYIRTRAGSIQDLFNMADTWNEGSTTFTAIKMNVTDTASDASSLLMDLQVGGASKFSIGKLGNKINFTDATFGAAAIQAVGARVDFIPAAAGGVAKAAVDYAGRFCAVSTLQIGSIDQANARVVLARDANDVLALRRSTNAQTFNLYNTYTDASNYERGFMKWNSNVLEIGTEGAGTGAARTSRMYMAGANTKIEGGTNIIRLWAGGGEYFRVGVGVWSMPFWASGTGLRIETANQSGVTDRAADPIIIDCKGGSGAGAAGYISFKAAKTLASGTTGHTSVEVLRVAQNTSDEAVVIVNDLPTADPVVAGQLWNDAGTLKISAG